MHEIEASRLRYRTRTYCRGLFLVVNESDISIIKGLFILFNREIRQYGRPVEWTKVANLISKSSGSLGPGVKNVLDEFIKSDLLKRRDRYSSV